MHRRVAIIGGGAAAAALLGELLESQPPQPLRLDWYTGNGVPARGVAYATRSDRHLLNVRAASMSMFAGKPQGFLDFAQKDDPSVAGTDFLPRRRYGDYLEAEVARATALGKMRGHDLRLVPFAADAVVPENDGVTVFRGEDSSRVDAAVLALGAMPPQPLPCVGAGALASGRYVVDPWPLLAAPPAEAPARVVVIGLGLTAADVLLELAARWPATRFTAISRHGLLPEPHLRATAVPSGDGAELVEAMRDAPEIRRWVQLLREAIAQEDDWRSAVDSLRPHVAALWAALPLEQRSRFLRHARWAWERVRHRMPPPQHAALAALEREGRLQRVRGHVQAIAVDGDGLRLELCPHGGGPLHALHAGLAVQATGMDFDVANTPHPLMRQLVVNRHVLPDPLGLGCRATPQGRLLHAGGAWPRLFAIGSLLRGTLWECTAMPEIRQQARVVARQLLAG
ncbi:MAG: pyridine nucleotide-disulfide oxidoreductase [Rhodanobacter sp. 68-29]|nr:FAD/NAD(P)-binding protein [Rhodanobacter sp.]ODU73010.1 MAG: pyridine nucleotide-disulfide oxidoreductase [Rhodanobacter sp. SCN 69-32]OJY58254.1 MAG: pyridine nucleotide-disulfide oxidoreductase [Rhodanobacter sp. 68-29]